MISLLLLLTTSFSFAQKNILEFKQKKQSFQKVAEGEIITLSYYFDYHGEDTLTMLPPKVDCTCTEVELVNATIFQNQTNLIRVTFSTDQKIGYQEREIDLIFMSTTTNKKYEQKLIFKGVVKASKSTKENYKHNK